MVWRSSKHLDRSLEEIDHPEKLNDLFFLRLFWLNCVYPTDYTADPSWPNLLFPTDAGSDYLQMLEPIAGGFPEAELYLALFGHFYFHDLIFDWTKSDIDGIATCLNREICNQSIHLPHRFGRLLYDRFIDMATADRTDQLEPAYVRDLLKDTSQGVYQCGRSLSGPLGLINSLEGRYIPPSLRIPLWHCSDTGCSALHAVSLTPPEVPLVKAYRQIQRFFSDSLGPPSGWFTSLVRLHRKLSAYHLRRGRRYYDLPALLADALIGAERTMLLELALKTSHAQDLRDILTESPQFGMQHIASPEEVAKQLGPIEQLQLLMVIPDNALVALIDNACINRHLFIPIGEIRKSKQTPPHLSSDCRSALSAIGIRAEQDNPWASLIGIVWRAYTSQQLIDDLEWRMGTEPGASVKYRLVQFARDRGPAAIVEELILKSRPATEFICNELQLTTEECRANDASVVQRLLWKLGFTPSSFDQHLARLNERLNYFKNTLVSMSNVTQEADREKIRSAGVNLFVSAEEVLERILAFNIWFLKCDHFLKTKFTFDPAHARKVVGETLGAQLMDANNSVAWNSDGVNTIGVLMRYLTEAVHWMHSLLDTDKNDLLRSEEDLPHFADNPDRRFPFIHTELWADADRSELST